MYSEEDLLDWLVKIGDMPDDPPSQRAIDSHTGAPSSQTYRNRFGTWEAALNSAGFSEAAVQRRQSGSEKYTESELIEIIKTKARELDRTPRWHDFSHGDSPSASTISRRFGTWNAALDAAGFEVTKQQTLSEKYTDAELLEHIRQAAQELGEPPSYRQMQDLDATPSPNTYQKRFGSWRAARERALEDTPE